MRRWIIGSLLALAAIGGGAYAAFEFSPWPKVVLIRHAFAKDAEARNAALAKHLPEGVAQRLDVKYGPGQAEALDLFYPADALAKGERLPLIVWIHGGGFIAGHKSDVASYLQILASRGYVAAGVGYSIAPGGRYPAPTLEANRALAFLLSQSAGAPLDPSRVILAGDSAGSQIAAQLAAALSDPSYAAKVGLTPAARRDAVRGVVLFCGVFDASDIKLDGPYGEFVRTAMWAYFGRADYSADPRLDVFSVHRHVTADFPPSFISVGNVDPLAPQSVMLAEALKAKGAPVETLMFPPDDEPLAHEYQFTLDTAAGRTALDRLTAFLTRVAK